MITERENFQLMLDGKQPEFVPAAMNLFDLVCPSTGIDRPVNNATGTDGFGVRWIQPPGQPPLPDPQQKRILGDIRDWRDAIAWPDLDAVDWEAAAKRDLANHGPAQVLLVQLSSGPTERLHDLMGFEEALVATMEDPEEVDAYIGCFCDFRIRQIEKLAHYYKPDIIQFQDDWGSQADLLVTPEFWHESIKPHIKRVIDATHDLGILFNMHTCGRVDRIIGDIVAMGPDLIDSMMTCNDLDSWMESYGHDTVFMGGLDAQGVIDHTDATKEQIEAEVKARIDRYAPKGNYIPMVYSTNPDNMVSALLFAARYGYGFGGAKHARLRFLKMLPHAFKLKRTENAAAGMTP